MSILSEAEFVQEFKRRIRPIKVQLSISITDNRLKSVQGNAEIFLNLNQANKMIELVLDSLETGHIYAEQGESIYASFGIDQSIEIYEEMLDSVSYRDLLNREDWEKEVFSLVTEGRLKEYIEKALNNYQFTDPSGKYRFRKKCVVDELARTLSL